MTPTNSHAKRRAVLVVGLAVLLIVAGVAGAFKLSSTRSAEQARVAAVAQQEAARVAAADQRERDEAARAAEAEEVAAVAAAAQRTQDAADEQERAFRAELVVSLEASIVEDAQEAVDSGYLDGPILRAVCTPVGGGSSDDLTAITGAFECIAINEERADGRYSGYGYTATVDWSDGSYQWQLDA